MKVLVWHAEMWVQSSIPHRVCAWSGWYKSQSKEIRRKEKRKGRREWGKERERVSERETENRNCISG